MAFDFKGNNRGRAPSSSYRSSASSPSGRGGGGSGGFQNRPRPSERPPEQGTAGSAPPRQSRPVRRPVARSGFLEFVPWNVVLPVLLVVAVVALCVIFRESIMRFLSDLLSLAIVLLIVIWIFKMLLFGNGK